MKKIILFALFAISVVAVSAQEKTSSHSKWKEKKDGVTYEMEVKITGTNTKKVEKPHVLFTTKGDTKNVIQITMTGTDNVSIPVPGVEGAKNFDVDPGKYVVKLKHRKLGEQVFDVELKKGDDKQITLTVR